MMAAGTLFGFLGVLLAVPLGAVVKILVQRAGQGVSRVGLLRPRGDPRGGLRTTEKWQAPDRAEDQSMVRRGSAPLCRRGL